MQLFIKPLLFIILFILCTNIDAKPIAQLNEIEKADELVLAVKNRNHRRLDSLLEYDADVNGARDCEGQTALIWAVMNNDISCLETLLERSAWVHPRDIGGTSALERAAAKGHADCLTMLLDHGARLHEKNRVGRTVLMRAAYGGSIDCIKIILSRSIAQLHPVYAKACLEALLEQTDNLGCFAHFLAQAQELKGLLYPENVEQTCQILLREYRQKEENNSL